jgi:hypothetical protein
VHVKQVSTRGPVEAEFEFARTLDDPQLCVFIQDDAHLYQLKPLAIGSDYVIEAVQILSQAELQPSAALSAHMLTSKREQPTNQQ